MSNGDIPEGFSITRILPVGPEEVWDAWTDPDAMSEWWHSGNTVTPREEIQADVQVGGHYRYTMVNAGSGERVVTGGVYQELDPPNLLAFTWGDHRAEPEDSPLVVVTLEPHGEDTLMYFELHGASGAPGDHFFYDGWVEALDELAGYLAALNEDD